MKKLLIVTLAALLALAALPVRAQEGATILAALPTEIETFFSQSHFADYTIGANAYVEITGTRGGDFAFAVASKGETQALYGFERQNGAWRYYLKTTAALPQRAGDFALCRFVDSGEDYLNISLTLPETEFEYPSVGMNFAVTGGGQWRLRGMYLNYPYDAHRIDVSESALRYEGEYSYSGAAYGVVETNLRYLSFAAFPKTLAEARQKLSNAPAIPAGSQLQAQTLRFEGGWKFPVYSGPGTQYERAAGGKAVVSTNDWIQVFGQENGYYLIQYALSSTQKRFGYIDASAYAGSAEVQLLSLDKESATILFTTGLTDDPLGEGKATRSLAKGESVVWLATMGNYVYIETTGSAPSRGFVPRGAVEKAAQAITGGYTGSAYAAQAEAAIESGVCRVTVTVAMTAGSQTSAITGYQLYANNVPVSADCTSVQENGAARFALTATLPANTSLIGLLPVYRDGVHADEAILLFLN